MYNFFRLHQCFGTCRPISFFEIYQANTVTLYCGKEDVLKGHKNSPTAIHLIVCVNIDITILFLFLKWLTRRMTLFTGVKSRQHLGRIKVITCLCTRKELTFLFFYYRIFYGGSKKICRTTSSNYKYQIILLFSETNMYRNYEKVQENFFY